MSERGRSGLNYSGGTVHEEFLPQLRGRQAITVYREMSENDPTIGAVLFAIDMLMRQVKWEVAPADNGANSDIEFLEQCMDDMSLSWSDFISEIMTMLVYGWSFHEIVYKRRNGANGDTPSKFNDGRIGWRKIAHRSQDSLDRWEFDQQGGVVAFVQKPPPKFEDIRIPIEKGLLFRTVTRKGNPEGRSVLRSAYRPWFFKKRIEEIEGVGIERDLAGLPIARVPSHYLSSSATADEKAMVAAIREILKNVRQDRQGGILWPNDRDAEGNEMFTFDLMTSGGSRAFDTSTIIQRYDQRITMVSLADFILMGHEKVGSFALSSDKTDLFAVALGAWLRGIEDVLNRFAVPRLFELNGAEGSQLPQIKHQDIEKPNLGLLGTFLTQLNAMGMPMFPDDNLEKHIRELLALPEPTEEAKSLQGSQQMRQLMEMMGLEDDAPGEGVTSGADQDQATVPRGPNPATGVRSQPPIQPQVEEV